MVVGILSAIPESLYFYHFMDSVGFVRDDKRHWIVQE